MIISDSEKFVFIHNPKVGGMTFRTALAPYDTRNNYFFEWKTIPGTERMLDMAHITAFQLYRHFPAVAADIADHFRFGFVREPYHRFLSAVSQHLKQSSLHIRRSVMSDPDLFYQMASAMAKSVLFQDVIDQDFKLVHFRRQSNFVWYDGKPWAHAIIPLETAVSSAPENVRRWLGDSLSTRLNRTNEISYYEVDRLTPAARRAIEEFYAPDFDRFGYTRR